MSRVRLRNSKVQWNVTEFDRGFAFSLMDTAGKRQYLGCSAGVATLLSEPTAWDLVQKDDEPWMFVRTFEEPVSIWARLRRVISPGSFIWFLSVDQRSASGRLYCRQGPITEAAFTLQTLRK